MHQCMLPADYDVVQNDTHKESFFCFVISAAAVIWQTVASRRLRTISVFLLAVFPAMLLSHPSQNRVPQSPLFPL